MTTKKLLDWSAKRSGASITVRGVDMDTRQPVIISGIDEIAALPSGIEALLKDGERVELVSLVGSR